MLTTNTLANPGQISFGLVQRRSRGGITNIFGMALIGLLTLSIVPALAIGGVLLGASLLGRWEDAQNRRRPAVGAPAEMAEPIAREHFGNIETGQRMTDF